MKTATILQLAETRNGLVTSSTYNQFCIHFSQLFLIRGSALLAKIHQKIGAPSNVQSGLAGYI